MTDLMQIVEFGNQTGNDPIRWDGHTSQYLVPATNRTRILDREHANNITPGGDGWLTFHRVIGASGLTPTEQTTAGYDHDPILTHWTRIRWDVLPHLETQELG